MIVVSNQCYSLTAVPSPLWHSRQAGTSQSHMQPFDEKDGKDAN